VFWENKRHWGRQLGEKHKEGNSVTHTAGEQVLRPREAFGGKKTSLERKRILISDERKPMKGGETPGKTDTREGKGL